MLTEAREIGEAQASQPNDENTVCQKNSAITLQQIEFYVVHTLKELRLIVKDL